MILKSLLFICSFLMPFLVMGTQYLPINLNKQIEEADAFVIGVVTDKENVEIDHKLWTKITLTISKSLNFNRPQVDVYLPGGINGDYVLKVESVDIPELGEEKNYLIKRDGQKYFLSNLALGEYRKEMKDGKEYFHSKVFETYPGLNKLRFEHFENASKVVNKNWKSSSFEVPIKLHTKEEKVLEVEKVQESRHQLLVKQSHDFRIILWVFALLFFVAVLYYTFKNKRDEK